MKTNLRDYALTMPQAVEDFPFDDVTLTIKVGGKMFAVFNLDGEPCVTLKATPEEILRRREHFDEVLEPRYFNKKHWMLVPLRSVGISENTLQEWIGESYRLVVAGLTKKVRNELGL